MKISIIKKEAQQTAEWSGGTSTELYIFPENTDYKSRNFGFRISTATVDEEESNFTSLLGYHRILMVLKGELIIHHEGQYSKTLKKLEVDHFNGAWNTKSQGKVIDFNLMLSNQFKGSLKPVQLKKEESSSGILPASSNFNGFYAASGSIELKLNHENILLEEGDFLILDKKGLELDYKIKSVTQAEIVLISTTAN